MIKDSDNVKLLEPGKTPAKRKVLVVEDNELNREILSSFLEVRFEVLLAENGEEGLKILREYYRELSVYYLTSACRCVMDLNFSDGEIRIKCYQRYRLLL